MSFEEFDDLSPEEFRLMCDLHQERELLQIDLENQRAGLIAATVFNAQRTKDSHKFWKWSDFFTRSQGKKEAQPTVTPEQQALSEAEILQAMIVTAKTNQRRKQAEGRKGNVSK